MYPEQPRRTRTYQNHHLDGTRWDAFQPRPEDIVISTAYKAGTTWMQAIVAGLVYGEDPLPAHLHELSPWLDLRFRDLDALLANLEGQKRRRFVKTHLPLDGLPWYPEVRYVVVARDPRDVFMSLENHYGSYSEEFYASVNETPGRIGDPLPRFEKVAEDVHGRFRTWLTRGWFEWERDGYPFWSFFHHLDSWWRFRSVGNVLFVHYSDLLADLPSGIRRVAEFLDIPVDDSAVERLNQRTSFAWMKSHAGEFTARGGVAFRGGADTFIHKGTNGRWRGVLDAEDLARVERAVGERLEPGCARWLALGGEPD